MPQPFDWQNQPEASGPMTEPRAPGGVALDIQALAQHTVRLPQLDPGALADGEYVPISRTEGLLDPETRERERHQAAVNYDATRDGLRAMFENAARHAGADPRVARRTADELMRQMPEPAAAEPGNGDDGRLFPAAEAEPAPEKLDDGPAFAEPAEPATEAAEPAAAAVPDEPAGPNSSDAAVRTETEPAAVRPRSKEKTS